MKALDPPEAQDWLTALFDLYATTLRAYATRRVGPDSADDIVSEVFAVAWRRRASVPEPALPWLLRVAHHTIAHDRRTWARHLRMLDAVADVTQDTAAPGADRASRALADSILAQLPPVDAEILRLTAWEGLTPAEIAIVLDLSDSAARTRLMRARKRAQRLLEPTVALRLAAGTTT